MTDAMTDAMETGRFDARGNWAGRCCGARHRPGCGWKAANELTVLHQFALERF